MTKSLLTVIAACIVCSVQAQGLPYLGTMTIIPQSPTAGDHIKIVTNVTTPNQGIIVDKSHTVTSSPNEIRIRGCYWNGMLTALDNFIDTFDIGQLPGGTYTIQHKAYLSSGQQVCHKIDSNMAVLTVSVAYVNLVGIESVQKPAELFLFPNPADKALHFTNTQGYTSAAIFTGDGRLIRQKELDLTSEVDIRDLPPGLYFIRFSNGTRSANARFIKVSGN